MVSKPVPTIPRKDVGKNQHIDNEIFILCKETSVGEETIGNIFYAIHNVKFGLGESSVLDSELYSGIEVLSWKLMGFSP
ncbi:hypothetical protein H5410_040408 [Solanum commersonii]|uniref:Uncharacterized protein n=1 Tax=Solanum commersonii TaxID=4109 RepID=A0A9J5XSE9_SOLCO|nr:hypothetical protein H5410_040408 [Solanum commersonii]